MGTERRNLDLIKIIDNYQNQDLNSKGNNYGKNSENETSHCHNPYWPFSKHGAIMFSDIAEL